MIFGQKRGVALYLKELAALNKITYTLIPTGIRRCTYLIFRVILHTGSAIPLGRDRL
jgi:hypothetical protein